MPSSLIDAVFPLERGGVAPPTRRMGMSMISVLLLFLAACSSDTSTFGSPAAASEATRVVEVVATDDMRFEPQQVTVSTGEIVTFRVTNNGQITHDFTLGDRAAQDRHAAEMAQGGHGAHDTPNVVEVAAGETAELTWSFTRAGTVLVGCHQPGHYQAGMQGSIIVGG